MSRPFGYLRKSSVRDPARDTSPETQEREVRALAKRHKDTIAKRDLLADWDVSGRAKYTKKRAEYLRLIDAIERGEVRAIYSYSLSRLGRSTAELSKLFDLCADRKIPIRLVADSVDTSTASGRMTANILSAVAQFEAEVASERQLAANVTKRTRALERGEDPTEAVRTSRRYGEVRTIIDLDGTTRVVGQNDDPDLVLEVFDETGTYTATSRRLNEMDIPARDGKKWWASSVKVVVERLRPELKAMSGKRGSPKGQSSFTLAKLLRCPQDGAMLTGSRIPDKKGKRWTRYSCRHAESVKHPRVSIAEHLIMPAIEAEAALYRDPDETDGGLSIEAQRQSLADRRQRIVEMRVDGLIDRAEASLRVAEIDSELNQLATPKPRDLRLPTGRTPAELNEILRQLFDHIVVDPDTFQPATFVWRNPAWREPDHA